MRWHERVGHAARRLVVLATAFALFLAPLVVGLTHAPLVHAPLVHAPLAHDALGADGETAAHGHAHGEAGSHLGSHLSGESAGESAGEPPGDAFAGHDPSDHDHQLHALVSRAQNARPPAPDVMRGARGGDARHLAPEGPKRPPRLV